VLSVLSTVVDVNQLLSVQAVKKSTKLFPRMESKSVIDMTVKCQFLRLKSKIFITMSK